MLTKEQAFGMYIGKKLQTDYCISVFTEVGRGHIHILGLGNQRFNINDCKLILRPFEDMTVQECHEYSQLNTDGIFISNREEIKNEKGYFPRCFEYLISIGIDLFNLKERGWAVYESDLKGESK